MSRAAAALVAAAACLVASPARAQLSLNTSVNPRKVEVGERFNLTLKAMSGGDERASDPQLKLPPGVSGSGPSVGSQSSMKLDINGRFTQSVGISATWVLRATQPGVYRLGPASVQTSNGRVQDRVVTVEVVPQGTMPRSTPPLGGMPMDPFNMLPGFGSQFPGLPGLGDPDQEPEEPQLPLLPEEYRIERMLDPLAFLRGRALPKKVVVGEQVTLSVYAYAGRGNFQPALSTEPSRDDFLAFNLRDDDQQIQGYKFEFDGQRWLTIKIQEFALFPLKSGKLKAGAMSFSFVGRSYSKDPQGLKRESAPVEIVVVEPPLNGRPPGYRVGDVGQYRLSAQIEPREVPAGGSIAVVAKLEGTGNVPASLLVPEQNGVRWLEPQMVEQIGPRAGVIQGFRTFTYVVELTQPGEVELGELTLPYWDPKAKAYGVARTPLGKVKVTGSARAPDAPAAGTEPGQRLKGLVSPAKKLGPARPSQHLLTSQPGYWAALLGLPLAALLGFAATDLARTLRRRFAEQRGSLGAALAEALSQLDAAVGSGDAAASAGAAERVLFLSIERATGLKARGVLKSQLEAALEGAGVPPDLAKLAAEQLRGCDELRFAGEAVDLASFATKARQTSSQLGAIKARQAQGTP